MRLAVDASTFVSEALRPRGRILLTDGGLELSMAMEARSEAEHELRRRIAAMVVRGGMGSDLAADLLAEALTILTNHVLLVSSTGYADRMREGIGRIPRDPSDARTVALALSLDCGILTADRDFFGCGLPVWTVDVLRWYLEWERAEAAGAGR